MKLKKPLEELLYENGKIDQGKLAQIKKARSGGADVKQYIVDNRLAPEKDIAEITSEGLGIPFIDLKSFIIDPAALGLLDEKTVRRRSVLPLYVVRDTLTIAMADPQDLIAIDEVKVLSKYKNVQVVMALKADILEAIEQNYTHGKTLEDIVKPLESKGIMFVSANVPSKRLAFFAEQAPVVKFVNQMIYDALKSRASDIHIEPLNEQLRVRFRIDGVLQTAINISNSIHLPIVPRLKILAGLDIAENRKPQDGRFSINVAGKKIDLRVATFPTAYGESMTIRLLDKSVAMVGINELGFAKDILKKFQRIIKSSHGILLVTGPTGCGKTTTLYAVLNRISSPEKNILTIEDPIEYLVDNVTQSQVNMKIGLDFASALRSFLRQDPDAMMIGEIRDVETAEMAFRAALTGHLVLSTLHTNDAATAVTRLRDLGLDANMISSSLLGVLAQRLVRVICSECKEEYSPDKSLLEDLKIDYDPKMKFYRGKGCDECNGTGYKGRIGIYELLEFMEDIKILIRKDITPEEIRQAAVKNGMRSLKDDGFDKVRSGITTLEELIRVTQA